MDETLSAQLPDDGETIKSCCASLYEHAAARLLVGESLHPGGLELTERIGKLIGLAPGVHLLDAASGTGASALFLAERFGCRVTGVDYGAAAVEEANRAAADRSLADRVAFRRADTEHLPFPDAAFDAVLCECAFCLFPDKAAAAGEFARVVRPGGRVVLSDLTRTGPLPPSLDGLLSRIACIADARPVDEYRAFLEGAGLAVETVETHDDALARLVDEVRFKLLGADVLIGLGKLDMDKADLATAKELATEAKAAVDAGLLGYTVVVAGTGRQA